MAANTLTNEQRDKLLEMLGSREPYADIAEHLGCSWANIDYYAKKYSDKIKAMREAHDARFIEQGLRNREYRTRKLENLARRLEKELENKAGKSGENGLYAEEVKLSASGMTVRYDVFNNPMVAQLRGLYEDIAKEAGGRSTKTVLSGPDDGPVQLEIDDVTHLTAAERSKRLSVLLESARNRRDLPNT